MSWKHTKQFESWNGDEVEVGVDLDGDIGFLDQHGYSIYIGGEHLDKLIRHLTRIAEMREGRSDE